jgi:hypothetical protein
VEFFAEWSLCPDNVAFLRVQTGTNNSCFLLFYLIIFIGVYDPALIGDKPKWYSRNLTSIPFNIVEDNSTLGEAVTSFTPTGKKFNLKKLIKFFFVLKFKMRVVVIQKTIVQVLPIIHH